MKQQIRKQVDLNVAKRRDRRLPRRERRRVAERATNLGKHLLSVRGRSRGRRRTWLVQQAHEDLKQLDVAWKVRPALIEVSRVLGSSVEQAPWSLVALVGEHLIRHSNLDVVRFSGKDCER